MSKSNSMNSRRTLSRLTRRIGTLMAIASVAVATACSTDSISAPREVASTPDAQQGLLSGVGTLLNTLVTKEGLARTTAVSQPVVVSQLITSKQGGSIELKALGLRLDIPQGAIPRDTMTITVTALPGNIVAYDFQPHGTKFLKALEFEQDLKGTSWEQKLIKPTLYGGYFKNPSQLNPLNLKALIDELIPTVVFGSRVEFKVWHFSGYMVSMD